MSLGIAKSSDGFLVVELNMLFKSIFGKSYGMLGMLSEGKLMDDMKFSMSFLSFSKRASNSVADCSFCS